MTRLDAFLFAPVDARSAAIFRLLLALLLALAFWEERSLAAGIARHPELAALWESIFRTPAWAGATGLALAAFAAGVGGRAAGLLLAVLLLPGAFERAYPSRQVLLFSLVAFGLLRSDPRDLWRSREQRSASVGPMWPVRLVQLQLSVLYAVNALGKLSPEYLSGEVLVSLSRLLPNFHADLSDGSLHLGPLALPAWLCAAGTVAVEGALAVGFWIPRLRRPTAALGLAFHGSLRWVISIGWLDWTCLFLYASFLLPFDGRPPHERVTC